MRQLYEYHPVIGFRFVPGIKARVPHEGGGYLVRTNAAGFRSDRPFTLARTPGKRRVLLFGDSFTAGEGVSNGQRYGDHLERLVPDLEVYNFGLPATGLDQHYLIYRECARRIDHDLLVISVYVENVRRVGSRYRYFLDDEGKRVLYAKPYFTLHDGKPQLHGVPPPRQPVDPRTLSAADQAHIFAGARFPLLKRIYNRLRRNAAFKSLAVDSGLVALALKASGYQPIKEYADAANAAWRVMQALIGEWISGHAAPVILMPIPLSHYVYELASPRAYQERLRSATLAAGGVFWDPLPALVKPALPERKAYYFPVDGHLTRAGHEALGHAMAPFIAARLAGFDGR